MSVMAVIFDFDETLVPDSTTKLLRSYGVDAGRFWRQARDLVARGYDAAPAYLNLLLELIGDGKPLGPLTNETLREFGATLDSQFFPGIPELFSDLRGEVARFKDISIEFYIVSGGLRSLIEGSQIVRKDFTAAYASELSGETDTGVLRHIKRCVTFTEKTRYLFEINKGIDPQDAASKPHLVNKAVDERRRRVPFRNMIYVGDGHTDIPCFSLVGKGTHAERGGKAFAVFNPDAPDKAKDAFRDFLQTKRVDGMHFPRYRACDELGSLIRLAVTTRCGDIKVALSEAETENEP